MPPADDALLTYADAVSQLKMSLRTVKQLAYDGELTVIRLSPRNVRIRQSDLDAYVARKAEASIYDNKNVA